MEAPFFELQGILVINLNLAHPKIEPLRGILTINFHNARAVLHQANFEPIREKNHGSLLSSLDFLNLTICK